jgi:hypothetical protein
MPGTRPGMTPVYSSLPDLIRQSMPTIGSAWTTDIGVQRTPFCERLCPVVTIGKISHRQIFRAYAAVVRRQCHCATANGFQSHVSDGRPAAIASFFICAASE